MPLPEIHKVLARLEPVRHIGLLLGLDLPGGEFRTTTQVGAAQPPSPIYADWRTKETITGWDRLQTPSSTSLRLVALAKKGIVEQRRHGRVKGTANPIIDWRLTDYGARVLAAAKDAGMLPPVPEGWQPNYTTTTKEP